MSGRRCRLLPIAALLLVSTSAFGQPLPVGTPADEAVPTNQIRERLLALRGNRQFKNLDDALLRDIIKNLPKDSKFPKFDQKMVEEFLKNNKDLTKQLSDPDTMARLQQLIQEHKNHSPPSTNKEVDWNRIENLLKNVNENIRKNPNSDPFHPDPPTTKKNEEPVRDPMTGKAPEPRIDRPAPPKKDSKDFDEIARWLSRNLGNSPALRDAAKDLPKLMNQDQDIERMADMLQGLETKWNSSLGPKNNTTGTGLDKMFDGMKMPDLNRPAPDRPSVQPLSDFNASPGGSTIGSVGDGDSKGISMMLMLIAVGILGFVVWRRFAAAKTKPLVTDESSRRTLSIDPLTIATREDVVRAFESLSLSKCGQEAVNWHHRQIASAIGDKEPGHQEAVDQLAGLYEKARYAPATEQFSETDVAAARVQVCQIAGVPTA